MQAAFTPPSTLFTFIAHCLVCHQHTLHTARLLDPCFKTGWREEDFKRASLGDWWALHGNPANRGTINCPPTVRPPPRRRASIETLGFSSAHPSSLQAPSCEPLCGVPLWSPFSSLGTLPFFALAQWTRRALLLFPFCSLYAISGSFNLPFGILFNFPSQYFSAIGLHVIFRFSWNLPAALRWNHNQRDSKRRQDLEASHCRRQGAFTLFGPAFQLSFAQPRPHLHLPQKEHRSGICIVAKPFSFDLCVLRSPLLDASCLFSFPPLNNMLKFSG